MSSDALAYVGAMDHHALIQVNELGTKVAANTRVIIYRGPPPPPRPQMRVDHPFFYAIVHVPTGTILTLGHFARPDAQPLVDEDHPACRPRQDG